MAERHVLYSIPQAARLCGISRVTLWKYVKRGELKSSRTPGGQHRIKLADLKRFARQKEMFLADVSQTKAARILIIDDDKGIRKLLVKALSAAGYQTEQASDGFEAGIKILSFRPHLVLLDLVMPNMDGFKVCEIIKQDEQTKNIKIIAISGFSSEENQQRIFNCGADTFHSKPLAVKRLLAEIAELLVPSKGVTTE